MLRVEGLDAGYGDVRILFGFDLIARSGEITCLLGRNGAGKTTALKAIMGLIPASAGRVMLDGEEIAGLPAHEVPRRRVGYVPQGRRLFAELTVAENIEIALMVRRAGSDVRERALDLFPRLRERLDQRADTLSGGEQQMLATARALCLEPRVLLLDEPTEGLQPSMVDLIRDVTLRLKREGVAVVLVEQRIDAVLALADRACFIENGRNRETLTGDALRAEPGLLEARLGV
ncbi:ABC transporter ATP-binding protein [Pikeienuella piscinae]|uniref:ABC transporter ATP-binding protein n=1 Tax=Pikeienuella piscinae TaxID=2748098 RepID=A0A7L5BW91_9RHOB|nr:ABC transporter ATP-binding protein [Pikeienuella piscinae]QIE56145.1 ABC transporter ATP-binding protein [Pikeienuella piscinae]